MTKKERKGYFYEEQEEAVKRYLSTTNELEKNKIFNTILLPAFTKMIESIIRRYNLHIPNEEFNDTFNDTISFLMSKIEHFDPDKISKKTGKKIKAYSYCGTICKNYLMFKSSQYAKKKVRLASYDEIYDEISNNSKFSTDDGNNIEFIEKLVNDIAIEIEKMIINCDENYLTDDEIKVGKALVLLLRNWEEVLPNGGSNKLQKSSVLYFLREETMMTTKEVRDNMKKYKNVYKLLKKMAIE